MERSEPALVPEWLRCTGSVAGGGTLTHHLSSSSLHSDLSMWDRCSWSNSDKHIQGPTFLNRSSSSNSRRSSGTNGSSKHPYSSFTRSHRDRHREKDKDRSLTGDFWDHDSSDPLDNILTSCIEKGSLRRSQSHTCRRTSEVLPSRTEDLRNGVHDNQLNGNSMHLGGSNLSDKDFPSLGVEEKQGGSNIGRVSSPVLSTRVQSLSIGNSGLLRGEKWTSALAEVPAIIGSNTIVISSAQQQGVVVSPPSGSSSSMTSLNMAEALSQVPARAHAAPQVSDKSQRLEELALKQSRQLIPVMPSMSKALVSSSSEKSKQPKAGVRANELVVSVRSTQQQHSSQLANQCRGGQVKSDAPIASHGGKFLVLKPGWENGATSANRDVTSPTNSAKGNVVNCQLPSAPPAPTGLTSPSNTKASTLEKKTAALTLKSRTSTEKKFSLSQAQSRSDFFNLMRNKTLHKTSSSISGSSLALVSPSCLEKSDENNNEADSGPVDPHVTKKCGEIMSNGDRHSPHSKVHSSPDVGKETVLNGAVYPDEEEVAFLRSLGWEENGEDEGLTEEEVNAFYQEYMKLRPSLKAWRGIQPKHAMLCESHSLNSATLSSDSSSAGS